MIYDFHGNKLFDEEDFEKRLGDLEDNFEAYETEVSALVDEALELVGGES